MLLFDNKEYEKFFNPLCCKNRRIYYECILKLIDKSKQLTLLYENDARDTLVLYFRNLAYAVEDEEVNDNTDEYISSKKTETENASAVLRYFRSCGWISERELGRNGDNIASVTPYCRKIIDAIERVFNSDKRASLTNHIFSIYDILKSAFDPDHLRNTRPYSNILSPVVESISELKMELLVLKDSIRSIMNYVIKFTETKEFGHFLIKDEMMNTFFTDYFFIKKDGLIPGYIEEIEKMLRRIYDVPAFGKMIDEYQSLKNVTPIQAREEIDSKLSDIKSFISYEYAREMDYIDRKINNYYKMYATRMHLILSNSGNLQTYLNDLLFKIKNMNPDEKQEALSSLSNSFALESYKYIGRKSIERRKRKNTNSKKVPVRSSNITDEERSRLTNELLKANPDRYGVEQVSKYFDNIMSDNEIFIPDDNNIKTKEDALMIAASIIHSSSDEFNYEIELLEGTIETQVAKFSNLQIKRKKA